MGRPIPEIRNDLADLAQQLTMGCIGKHKAAARLYELIDDTYRNSPVKKAAATARKMTNEIADEVIDYAAAHPEMSNRQIGRHFGIDGGRVSEALTGKRWDVPLR